MVLLVLLALSILILVFMIRMLDVILRQRLIGPPPTARAAARAGAPAAMPRTTARLGSARCRNAILYYTVIYYTILYCTKTITYDIIYMTIV